MKEKIAIILKRNPLYAWILKIDLSIIAFVILAKLPYIVDVFMGKESFSEFIRNVFLLILIFVISELPLILTEVSFKLGRAKNSSKIDFFNSKLMYREIIHKYSAVSLRFLDCFKSDFYSNIAMILMSLQLKKKIKFERENNIIVINKDISELTSSEKYVLERIKDGKVLIRKHQEIADIVDFGKKEALEFGLMVEKNVKTPIRKKHAKVVKYVSIFLILFLILYVLPLYLLAKGVNITWLSMEYLVFVLIGLIMAVMILYIIDKESTEIHEKLPTRTPLGEDINEKLEGLKNYISQYSMLDEREKEELELWDEYLIYSVLFEHNQKIIVDLQDCVNDENME